MKHRKITKDEINKITQISPPRERAFFTIMRQSGLPPHRIKQLKIGDVEEILDPNPPNPCKINALYESPNFVGKEAVKYIRDYLDKRKKREKPTTENLLFTAKNKPNKEINTRRVSIVFKESARKKTIKIKNPDELKLYSLVEFYKNTTEDYQKELKELNNDPTPKDDEFYRELYRKKALENLEIEPQTLTDTLHRLETQNKEVTQRLTEIENRFIPKESPEEREQDEKIIQEDEEYEKWMKDTKQREHWEEEQKKQKKFFEDHPEEAKRFEEQMDAEAEQMEKYYTYNLEERVKELTSKLKEVENIIIEHRKTRQKPTRNVFPPSKHSPKEE
jgi:hypothetical protein